MLKLLLILILMTALDASVVKIITEGIYTQPKYSLKSHTPDETLFARGQALAIAKENAAQEAGTTIYSQISSKYDKTKDKYEFKSELKAISSAIVTYKVIKEGWKKDLYFVKIEAKVDVTDAEEIFNKADKRLQKIKDLQSENETILAALKNVADKIMTLNRNKYTSENIYEIKELNTKIEDNQFEQSKLVREYEDNILLMRTSFKKGTLLAIANKNEEELIKAKKQFDKEVIRPFKEKFIAKILNIDVVKHGDTADITFILGIVVKHNLKMPQRMRSWIDGKKISKDIYTYGSAYSVLLFNDKGITKKLVDWIRENRSLVIKVNIGERNYITEKFAYYSDGFISDTLGLSASYDGGYKLFDNTHAYLSFRTMKNIPISELENLDSIRADLVFSNRDIKVRREHDVALEYALPSVKEARDYYPRSGY